MLRAVSRHGNLCPASDPPPRTPQSGNSRFCSRPDRKKRIFFRANARKTKNKTKKHKNTPKKAQKHPKRRKNTQLLFALTREIKPLSSKQNQFPSPAAGNETKQNPVLALHDGIPFFFLVLASAGQFGHGGVGEFATNSIHSSLPWPCILALVVVKAQG